MPGIQINTGRGGNALPQVGGSTVNRVAPDNSGAAALGEAVFAVGDKLRADRDKQIMDEAAKAYAEEKAYREERQRVSDAKHRAEAGSAWARLQNDVADAHDLIGRDVTSGKLTTQDAESAFQVLSQKAKEQHIEPLLPEYAQALEDNYLKATGAAKRSLVNLGTARQQAEIGGNLSSTIENLQRFAVRDPINGIKQAHAAYDTLGPDANIGPEQLTKQKQLFTEQTWYNHFNAGIQNAAMGNDRATLEQLAKRLEGADGAAMDPPKRLALTVSARAYVAGIDQEGQRKIERAQRKQEARDASAVGSYNKYFDLAQQGHFFSVEAVQELMGSTAGTPSAKAAAELVQSQGRVAGFAGLPTKQMGAEIERMQAASADPASGVNVQEAAVLKQFKTIYAASVEAYKNDPWDAAQVRGAMVNNLPIDATNITTALQGVKARLANAPKLDLLAGYKVSPLRPAEAEQLSKAIRVLPIEQQSSALAQIGQVLDDPDRLGAVAAQIDKKDAALGIAMAFGTAKTTRSRYTAELVLRGERAIREKAIKIDDKPESGVQAELTKELGDAFPNAELRQKTLEAAYYIAAGLQSEGKTNIKAALTLAAGEIVTQYDRSKLPLPMGYDHDRFRKELRELAPASIKAQTPDGKVLFGGVELTTDKLLNVLPDTPLVHAGQGRYSIRAGNSYATDSQGRRLIVEIGRAR